ncbi:MAG: hypothetical protein IMF16_02215, partial [Proteobacteria bacterium]|nr:hypothetical protein [Pseudomonadota bacterium]
LVPLAIAVFNVVQSAAGDYVTHTYTEFGRQIVEHGRVQRMPILWASPLDQSPFVTTLYKFVFPVPGIFFGKWYIPVSAALVEFQLGEQGYGYVAIMVSGMGPIAAAIPTALLLSGYLGVAGGAVSSGQPCWADFGRHMRRYWFRFWLLYVLLSVLVGSLLIIAFLLPSSYFLSRAGNRCGLWMGPVIAFLLALAQYAVVVDDASVARAIKRSVVTVTSRICTALILLAAFLACEAAVVAPLSSMAYTSGAGTRGSSLAANLLAVMPWRVVAEGWQALLGACLCLAMFYWYRDANRQRAPESDTASTAQAPLEG